MNKTTTEIETKLQTPFGDLRKRSIYTPTAVNVSGGIYLSDRETAKNDLVIEELFLMYIAGQTYGEIIVDGKEISFDILFEFKDVNGNVILPQDMNIALLYNIIYNEVMGLQHSEFCTYEIKSEYFLDERRITEKEPEKTKEPDYLPTLGKCNLKREKVCGYCEYHKCYLSAKQIIGKSCVQKGCHHFRREDHPFWKNQGLSLLNKEKQNGLN